MPAKPSTVNKEWHPANCHCQKIKLRVGGSGPQTAMNCNCSIVPKLDIQCLSFPQRDLSKFHLQMAALTAVPNQERFILEQKS